MTGLKRWKKVALVAVIAVVGLELLYLVGANIILATGLVERLANQRPQSLQLRYRSAFTPWPGRVYAREISIAFQDHNQAFELAMATSRVDVALTALLSRKLYVKQARATGVAYRMLLKVDTAEGTQARVGAFPQIEGVARPPLRIPPPEEAPLSKEDIDRLWSIEFHDVESEIVELWLFEYRYRGLGKSHGAFGVAPMKEVWVGPVSLALEPGTLFVGEEVVSEKFSMGSKATIAPFDISTAPGLEMFKGISGQIHVELPISSLAFAALYLPGANAQGRGTITAEVQIKNGVLEPATKLEADLPHVRLRYQGFGFEGGLNGGLKVTQKPVARAVAAGTVLVPLPEQKPLSVTIEGATGSLSLASADLSTGVALDRLHGGIEKAEAADARPLVALASQTVPYLAEQLLGDGPLTSRGTIDLDRKQMVVRVPSARLGRADGRGAIALRGNAINGAIAGHAGEFSLGINFENGVPFFWPFVGPKWLGEKLATHGLELAPAP